MRAALFAHLDSVTTVADNREMPWDQTGWFTFAGERFTVRETRGRGICKPRNLDAALSITTTYTTSGQLPVGDARKLNTSVAGKVNSFDDSNSPSAAR